MSKYLSLNHLLISKTLAPKIKSFNNWVSGGGGGGVSEEVVPPNHFKMFVSKISTDSKKQWHLSLSHSKKNFGGGKFGESWEGGTSKLCQGICFFIIS